VPIVPNSPSVIPPVNNNPPPGGTSDPLGLYTITEMGSALQSDPTFNTTINGYTDKLSYNPGDKLTLYLSGPFNDSAVIPLKDAQGNTVLTVSAAVGPQTINSNKPWVDGFMFSPTLSINLPASLKSGIYTWAGSIPFVVKGTKTSYDLTVVYPTNTLNAYNFSGGKSLYAPDFNNRATVLSFLRSNTLGYGEFYKWLDKQSYNINYISDSDLDDYNQIKNSTVVAITGHSEYWTKQARLNIDKFVESGRNVLMLSGNSMWWQVRYNKSKNVMICYKSVDGSDKKYNTVDPMGNTVYSSVNWGTAIVNYPIINSMGSDYRWGGYGNTLPNAWNGYKILVANSPLFKGTGLKNGDILSMPTREYDGAPVVNLFGQGSSEIPVIDNTVLNFYKVELLGFDFAQNLTRKDKLGFGTFMLAKKSASAGTVVNAATMDWCTNVHVGSGKVQTITKNMIDLSLSNSSLFSK
ncbi:MAG: N,N-dimethylformamidase beta subunit family domain-containing protein, partial [Mucilaginibacter sp.]